LGYAWNMTDYLPTMMSFLRWKEISSLYNRIKKERKFRIVNLLDNGRKILFVVVVGTSMFGSFQNCKIRREDIGGDE